MPKFLVAIYRERGYEAAVVEGPEMHREIDALNEEMVAAGVRTYVGGLRPPEAVRSIRRQADGATSVTEGLYLDSAEHIGGLWVLDVADMDAALEWGQKAAVACRANVEVRPFF